MFSVVINSGNALSQHLTERKTNISTQASADILAVKSENYTENTNGVASSLGHTADFKQIVITDMLLFVDTFRKSHIGKFMTFTPDDAIFL